MPTVGPATDKLGYIRPFMTPLARWADDELHSTNAQIEFLLRYALADAGWLPGHAGRMRPGRRLRAGSPNSPDHRGCPIACSSVSSGRPRRMSHGVTTSM
jgi:hypothetical protein